MPTTLTRRTALAAVAAVTVLPAAGDAHEVEDPVLPLYREWIAARAEWSRMSYLPGNEDFDTPEMKAAEAREDAAFSEMIELTPVSPAGIAAFAALLWYLVGPSFPPGDPIHREQCKEPANRLLVAIWRATSGQKGLPPENEL